MLGNTSHNKPKKLRPLSIEVRGVSRPSKIICMCCGSKSGINHSVHRSSADPCDALTPLMLMDPHICQTARLDNGTTTTWYGVACQDCCSSGQLEALCLLHDLFLYQNMRKDTARQAHVVIGEIITKIREAPSKPYCVNLV